MSDVSEKTISIETSWSIGEECEFYGDNEFREGQICSVLVSVNDSEQGVIAAWQNIDDSRSFDRNFEEVLSEFQRHNSNRGGRFDDEHFNDRLRRASYEIVNALYEIWNADDQEAAISEFGGGSETFEYELEDDDSDGV